MCWRGAYGLEPLHDCGRPAGELCSVCYVCHTVTILRAIRRVRVDFHAAAESAAKEV